MNEQRFIAQVLEGLAYASPENADALEAEAAALEASGRTDLTADEITVMAQAKAIRGRNPEMLLRLLYERLTPTLALQIIETIETKADLVKQPAWKPIVLAQTVIRVMDGEELLGGEPGVALYFRPGLGPRAGYTKACDTVADIFGFKAGRTVSNILDDFDNPHWQAYKKKHAQKWKNKRSK